LLICRKIEELVKHWEHAVLLQDALQAGEEAKQQLEFPPVSRLKCRLHLHPDSCHCRFRSIAIEVVRVKDDSGDERDLERLFDEPNCIQLARA
jgi:hypothetical protein